jgi:allantoinase
VSPRADLAIRGALVISDGAYERDILIRGGVVSALVESGASDADEEIDASGLLALPGVVDAHVHFNDPGRAEWEGWASGSRAAAAGGTTTVADMPLNSLPPVLDGAAFDRKRAAGEARSLIDFALWGGLVDADVTKLRDLKERGAVGVKAFLCDSGVPEFPALRDEDLEPALRAAAAEGLLIALHCEDDALAREGSELVRASGRGDAAAWALSRPPLVEVRAVARACAAARDARARIHVVHLSAVEALGAIGAARRMETDVSVETCPHFLVFDEEDVSRAGAALKCAPPIRDARNRDMLWDALSDGRIDFVASDHSPCPSELKQGDDVFAAWGGIAGAQTLLAATFSEARWRADDVLDVKRIAGFVVWRLCARPAQRLGLWPRKGRIAPGSDADIVLFDPDAEWRHERAYSRAVDPYLGRRFRGRVVRSLVRGRSVFHDGEIDAEGSGGRFLAPLSMT